MDEVNVRVGEQKTKDQNEMMKKHEETKAKQIEKQKNINRLNRMMEYRNKMMMDELEEKEKKLNDYKVQKAKIAEQKSKTAQDIQKQKEEIISSFDKLMKQNKEFNVESIKKLFPDDEEFYNK